MAEHPEGPRRMVLVIEDDAVDRERILRWLGLSYAVCQAPNLAQGLDMVERLQPSCILLDYQLQDGTALDALEAMTSDRSQVIVVTGHGSETVAANSIKLGAFEYLPKDHLTKETLIETVERAIEVSSTKAALLHRERELGSLVSATREQLIPALERIRNVCLEHDLARPEDAVQEAGRTASQLRTYFERLLQYVSCTRENPWSRIDLREVVSEVRQGLPFPDHVELALDDLPILFGDENSQRLLFTELLGNCLQHGGEGLRRLRAISHHHASAWKIVLQDDGQGTDRVPTPGIPKLGAEGGWGIPIAHRVALAHGGNLHFDSSPGGGTKVSIVLQDRR